ncbi:MAG TPA: SgcJ/EcaC family oxidoreductase [Candidatus Nitrosotalea sp.]|nr:SgcJ/EcaC family oxidoreductase [Candidatus Nitrosotalea sp.]
MTQTDYNETAIRGLIDHFVAGWNAADVGKLAGVFAVDADFTAITGLRARGRNLIARGHDEILSTIYRGTRNSAQIESIHFLRPDIAVVDVKFTLRREDGSLAFGIPYSSAGIIATQDEGVWAIAVFRNMVPFARPVAGPLDRELTPVTTT